MFFHYEPRITFPKNLHFINFKSSNFPTNPITFTIKPSFSPVETSPNKRREGDFGWMLSGICWSPCRPTPRSVSRSRSRPPKPNESRSKVSTYDLNIRIIYIYIFSVYSVYSYLVKSLCKNKSAIFWIKHCASRWMDCFSQRKCQRSRPLVYPFFENSQLEVND